MLTCFDVANYFSWLAGTLSSYVTHIKLQKLVYYAQGFHLALYDEPLFAEDIKAWDSGPVAPVLWREYTFYGYSPIPVPDKFDISIYSEREIVLLNGVYSKFGHLDSFRLAQITQREHTWINAYPQGVITQEAMKKYFKTCLNSDNSLKDSLLPSDSKISTQQSDVKLANSSEKADIKKSEAFQAYLASKKERFEVYRRLATF